MCIFIVYFVSAHTAVMGKEEVVDISSFSSYGVFHFSASEEEQSAEERLTSKRETDIADVLLPEKMMPK